MVWWRCIASLFPCCIRCKYNVECPFLDLFRFTHGFLFQSTFLHEGVGFPLNHSIIAVDVIGGQKLGWALGSTLYEINTLPWTFGGRLAHKVGVKPTIIGKILGNDYETSSIPGIFGVALFALGTIFYVVRFFGRGRAMVSFPRHAHMTHEQYQGRHYGSILSRTHD